MTAYGTVTQFKTRTDRDETISAAWTTAIGEILDAVSRKIDNICKVPDSYFVATTDTTRHLSGKGNNFLKIPDCVDITTISVKVDYDDCCSFSGLPEDEQERGYVTNNEFVEDIFESVLNKKMKENRDGDAYYLMPMKWSKIQETFSTLKKFKSPFDI